MSDQGEKYHSKYKYQIGEFVGCLNEKGQAELDIVPSLWIRYKFSESKLILKYPDNNSSESFEQLQNMVKLQKEPSKSWPAWDVEIKGGANDYETAVKRMEILKTNPYAFTTDQEENFQAKAQQQTELYKKEALHKVMTISKQSDDQIESSSEELLDSEHSYSSSESDGSSKVAAKSAATKRKKSGSRSDSRKNLNSGTSGRKKSSGQASAKKPKKDQGTPSSSRNASLNDLDSSDENPKFRNQRKSRNESAVKSSKQTVLKFLPKLKQSNHPQNEQNDCSRHERINDGRSKSATFLSSVSQQQESEPISTSHNDNSKRAANNSQSTVNSSDRRPMNPSTGEASQMQPNKYSKYSEETQIILKFMASLKVDVQELRKDVKQLMNEQTSTNNFELLNELEKLEIKWPLETEEQWDKFNDELKKKGDLFRYFIKALKNEIDRRGNSPTKSMHNICRLIFVKDLIMKFTPLSQGKDEKKTLVFKEYFVYSVVRDVLYGYHTSGKHSIGKKEYHDALRLAFGNGKDWGGRAKVGPVHGNHTLDGNE
ncbi:hypothetical protein QAD02_002614 [Eretmocerus hayati]|uniref:Uncharacterized protein n=1 Tax=Eretmocerus hayati TaxID=131215 RepID=A0ACC2NPA2_9HYME|nr:hypothetical protein QAD02_002614 [Eretmocerus hayati]